MAEPSLKAMVGRTVRSIAEEIVAREGGFVNDPDDPGGATNFGVTIHTMRALGLDLDRDGDVDVADVRALPRSRAVDIFIEHYFRRPRIDALPDTVHASVFDMQVNAGANAVRILQRLLCQMGHAIVVDGRIGPRTATAARACQAKAPGHFSDAYGIARRNWYYALADRRPASRKYARRRDGGKGGWITRAEEFISPRYHLSAAEHRARVAAWG
ncbi:putative Peptidoglycan domain protein [Jannaschia seosinensis]|uniref:Putative Peptidoglycan domain protein n=1 Tax=Jannaschia seosinensis TaxID=313367 RepID=A0A0M7B753_9RHOB|nr:holin-associated N-acetylmuramidase [Jannaschia seosinensis]CUH22124.1 putative Peptidoglycan domain protein [Jannaschia seosinensis]